jgi:small-conductance mechanosensitive channel/CRP-like cAMP-binding protein
MRLVPPSLRFVVFAVILVVVSLRLLEHGGLPLSPHALATGPTHGLAQLLGVVWWVAAVFVVHALTTIGVALIERLRGTTGHRGLRFVSDAAGVVYAVVAAIALSAFVFDLPVSTVFATSSVLAVVLGIALQSTVGDLLGGLALNLEEAFRLGDRIDVDERTSGRVVEMTWRSTHLLARSGDLAIVPNSLLSRSKIINHDARGPYVHRSTVSIKLENTEAPARVRELLRAAALSARGVLAAPEPLVEIAAFTDWALEYRIVFFYIDHSEELPIASAILEAAWSHLAWAGIALPLPRTILARQTDGHGSNALDGLLSRVRIFERLTSDERRQLAGKLAVRHVIRGTRLIAQGESGSSLFIVCEGALAVLVADADGREREVARLFPGDYVGEASLLTGAPRNASIDAVTDAAVYEIEKDAFEPFLRLRPEMTDALAAALGARAVTRDAVLAEAHSAHESGMAHIAQQIRSFFRH